MVDVHVKGKRNGARRDTGHTGLTFVDFVICCIVIFTAEKKEVEERKCAMMQLNHGTN